MASSSFTAMGVLAAWKVEVLSLFLGFSVLHCHGVWGWRIPCFGDLEGGSFELISSLVYYRISEDALGSFSAPFRAFVVLHCHGV